ncbi:MAG: amidohydrolase family protein [Terrimonas sp.]|nr:amidohydrolase family protein [Terrimonas sp.]
MRSPRIIISFFLILNLFITGLGQSLPLLNADEKVFYNGKIFTASLQEPYAEAVAVYKEKILAVGNLNTVQKAVSKNAVWIDLEGQTVLPGLIDSHTHAIKGGISLGIPNVYEQYLAPDSLFRFVSSHLQHKNSLTGDVLLVYGINITTWSSIAKLNALFNEGAFEQQPVFLRGSDGHTGWANRSMLQKAGVTQKYLQSVPASFRKFFGNQSGEPDGFVADSGMQRIFAFIPTDQTDYHAAAQKAMLYNNRHGITAWLDPSAADLGKSGPYPFLNAYSWLQQHNQLHAHIALTLVADANKDPQSQIGKLRSLQKKVNQEDLSIIGFKIFADGVLEYPTQTAALSKPYTNTGERGNLLFDPAGFARFVSAADREKILVHVHAIGDRAVTASLDGFEKARNENGHSGIPHTITHLQIVQPKDFHRFHDLDVLASFQLLWAFADATTVDIVQPYIDSSLYKWQYPARSLLQSGATICGASDWPVSSGNPFEAMARGASREGSLGILDATQQMPRMALLMAYTINAARALMINGQAGSIEKGKWADMILVDRDVMTVSPEVLKDTKVLWTLFRGKIVYQAN